MCFFNLRFSYKWRIGKKILPIRHSKLSESNNLYYFFSTLVNNPFFPDRAECKFDNLRVYIFHIEDEISSIQILLLLSSVQKNLFHFSIQMVQCITKLFTIFLLYNICYYKSNSLSRWILLLYSCYNIHWRCLELFLMANHWSPWNRKWWSHHYILQFLICSSNFEIQWNSDVFLKVAYNTKLMYASTDL